LASGKAIEAAWKASDAAKIVSVICLRLFPTNLPAIPAENTDSQSLPQDAVGCSPQDHKLGRSHGCNGPEREPYRGALLAAASRRSPSRCRPRCVTNLPRCWMQRPWPVAATECPASC